jgi:hypothetical protein
MQGFDCSRCTCKLVEAVGEEPVTGGFHIPWTHRDLALHADSGGGGQHGVNVDPRTPLAFG